MLSGIVSRRSKFGRRYFAYFVAVWLVMIACFVLVERWSQRNTTAYHEAQFNEQQEAQVLLAKQGINDRLQSLVRDLRVIPGLAVDSGVESLVDITPIVSNLLAERPEVIGVMTYDNDKKIIQAVDRSPQNIEHIEALTEPFLQHLNNLEHDGEVQISGYHYHDGRTYLAFASSLEMAAESDRFSWLIVFIDAGYLFDVYVAPLRVGEFGAGYVLDQNGNILYDHEPEVIGRNVFDGMHDKYPDLLELDKRMLRTPEGKDEYQFTVERGGAISRKLIAWNSLAVGENRLVIAMSAPDVEIHASIDESRRVVFAAIGLLILGFGVTSFVLVQMRQRLLRLQTEDLARRVEERTQELNRELQARIESEDRFRDFAESTSDWLWEMDRELKFTFLSKRYEDITGFDGGFAIGKTRNEMIGGGVEPEVLRHHNETLQQRRAFRDFRYDLKSSKMGTIPVIISGKPVFDDAGNFRGYRGVGKNITEQVRAQEIRDQALREAERANLAKSEFLAAMSHELRTPLNAILGFSEVIHKQLLGPPESNDRYTEYARDIHSSAAHLLDLVNDLLDVSAIEAGKADVYFEPLQLAPLIDESLQAILATAEKKGIEVKTEITEGLPDIEADARAVRQILLNLLSNAIKFTEAGGAITISAESTETGALVQVIDTGVGISRTRLNEITRPFVREHRDPYKAERGWGLGLAIVNSLVMLHGGQLRLESELGAGTTVSFNLCKSVPETNVKAVSFGEEVPES